MAALHKPAAELCCGYRMIPITTRFASRAQEIIAMSIAAAVTTDALCEPIRNHDVAAVLLVSCLGYLATLILMTVSNPFAEAVAMLGQF